MLEELSKYHDDWLRIANSFLNNKSDAEDLVQEMYLKYHRLNIKAKDIAYKNEVNRYFVYRSLKNLAIDFIKKKREFYPVESLDFISQPEPDEKGELLELIQKEMETWEPYDKLLFEIYMYSGLSLRDISHGTTKKARIISNKLELRSHAVKTGSQVSVSSMFNTIKICKQKLRDKFNNHFKQLNNGRNSKAGESQERTETEVRCRLEKSA